MSTLLTFGQRSAVSALRQRDLDLVKDGLTAVAMIQYGRSDFRDVLVCLSLLYHAARRVGADPDRVFQEAASLAEQKIAALMTGYANRTPEDKDIHRMGYEEVATAQGIGFIGWGCKPYSPSFDMRPMAMEIADVIRADKYQPCRIEVASELIRVWFRGSSDVDRAIRAIRGGVQVSGKLRPGEHPNHDQQMFLVMLAEVARESDVHVLLEASQFDVFTGATVVVAMEDGVIPQDHMQGVPRRLALSKGLLFSLIVARSTALGVFSYETPQALRRFSNRISAILAHYAAMESP